MTDTVVVVAETVSDVAVAGAAVAVAVAEPSVTVVTAGTQGPPGVAGPAGPGVPAGGGPGQYLRKQSAADYDTAWAAVAAGVTSVYGRVGAVIAAAGDYLAAQVGFTPAGSLAATTVQAALEELDAGKAAASHTHSAADLTTGTLPLARGGTGASAYTPGRLVVTGANALQAAAATWDAALARLGVGTATPQATLHATGTDGSVPVQVTQAGVFQSAPTHEWRDAGGVVKARVTADAEFSNPGGFASEQFGQAALASGSYSVAVGQGATATGSNCVVVGQGASTGAANSSFVLGNFINTSSYQNFVAIGLNASPGGNGGVAVGTGAVGGDSSFAGGPNANASGGQAVAVGGDASATHQGAISLGRVALSDTQGDITFGGFGASSRRLRVSSPTSASNCRQLFSLDASWLDSADATRTARLSHKVTGNAADREYLRAEGDGAGVRLGFFGGTAAARPTITGSTGGNAALASLVSALAALGLVTDATSA